MHGGTTKMKLNPLATSILAIAFGASGLAIAQPYTAPASPYIQEGGWDAPPPGYRDVQRRGFHDGIEGARKDFENHRPPSPENRDEYRHPPVSHDLRHDYREAFRRGYMAGMDHMGRR
jgi:hypothetical protein